MGSKRASLRMAFVVGAVLLLSQHMAVEGVVISVSWQQNTLLLDQPRDSLSSRSILPERCAMSLVQSVR